VLDSTVIQAIGQAAGPFIATSNENAMDKELCDILTSVHTLEKNYASLHCETDSLKRENTILIKQQTTKSTSSRITLGVIT